jgi:hypothetical protein
MRYTRSSRRVLVILVTPGGNSESLFLGAGEAVALDVVKERYGPNPNAYTG